MRNLVARGAQVTLHPCTVTRRRAAGTRRRRVLPGQRPRRPGRARPHRRRRCASSSASARCGASASATSCSARPSAWRPTSCPSATAAPTTRSRTSTTGRIEITSPEPRLRGPRPGGARAPGHRRAGALGDRLRRRRADARQPLRPHGRGAALLDVPALDGPVPPRGRARPARRPATSSTASWTAAAMPRRDDIQQDPDPRLGADRDRPGGRVRLLRHAGLQGPARGGLRDRPRQLEPGDDHDRPGVRRRDLRRAAAARARSRR